MIRIKNITIVIGKIVSNCFYLTLISSENLNRNFLVPSDLLSYLNTVNKIENMVNGATRYFHLQILVIESSILQE